MPTIVSIGGNHYLVRRSSDAAAIIKALADAVALDRHYTGGRDLWTPSKYSHHSEVSMRTVAASDIQNREPGDIELNAESSEVRHHAGPRTVKRIADAPKQLNER